MPDFNGLNCCLEKSKLKVQIGLYVLRLHLGYDQGLRIKTPSGFLTFVKTVYVLAVLFSGRETAEMRWTQLVFSALLYATPPPSR